MSIGETPAVGDGSLAVPAPPPRLAARKLARCKHEEDRGKPHQAGRPGEAGLMMKMRVRGPRNIGAVETLDIHADANKAIRSSSVQLNRD